MSTKTKKLAIISAVILALGAACGGACLYFQSKGDAVAVQATGENVPDSVAQTAEVQEANAKLEEVKDEQAK